MVIDSRDRPLFPLMLRVVGAVGIVEALIGLAVGVMTLVVVPRIDSTKLDSVEVRQRFDDEVDSSPHWSEEQKQAAKRVDFSAVSEAMQSAQFRDYFTAFSCVGIVFNLLLAVLSYLLARGRASAVLPFVWLMLVLALYLETFSRWYTFADQLAFSTAWGVGNVGVGFPMLTLFWIWGPLVVVLGRGLRFGTRC